MELQAEKERILAARLDLLTEGPEGAAAVGAPETTALDVMPDTEAE